MLRLATTLHENDGYIASVFRRNRLNLRRARGMWWVTGRWMIPLRTLRLPSYKSDFLVRRETAATARSGAGKHMNQMRWNAAAGRAIALFLCGCQSGTQLPPAPVIGTT